MQLIWSWCTLSRERLCSWLRLPSSVVCHARRFLSREALIKIFWSKRVVKEVTTSKWGALRGVWTLSIRKLDPLRPTGTMLWFRQPMKRWERVICKEKTSIAFSISSIGELVFRMSHTSIPPCPAENSCFPSFENSRALISPRWPFREPTF